MTIKLRHTETGKERAFETRAEAEQQKEQMVHLGTDRDVLEIVTTEDTRSDGGTEVDIVDHNSDSGAEPETSPDAAPDLQQVDDKDISDDPLSVMPGHFVDTIQGVPTINRKGYAVLAEHFGVSVKAEPVTLPSETDFEYAEFKAIATTEDGTEYSGFGSAHVERMDGDDAHLLGELAETRSMKRAVSWATGIGITAMSEMRNSL